MMSEIMIERVIPFTLNGTVQRPFLCTPEHLDELACGWLMTQGGLEDFADIERVSATDAEVSVTLRPGVSLHAADILHRLDACTPCASTLTVTRAQLVDMCTRLLADEDYFGTHRLMLRYGTQEVFREDVGRHNAADKCAAYALRNGWDLTDCILGSTGRISLEMLAKAAVMGIPVFFSRKYPSDIAIAWAEKLNIALVARAHAPNAMTVSGAAWRIV